MPVPEHAKLLESLDALERRRRELGEAAQEAGTVGVQAEVAKRPGLGGQRIAVHVATEAPAAGVDTPQDLERVRALLGAPPPG